MLSKEDKKTKYLTTEANQALDQITCDFRDEKGRGGRHRLSSPVVGSRANELRLIYEHKAIFEKFQQAIYFNHPFSQQLFIIPAHLKEKADDISKRIFEQYIDNMNSDCAQESTKDHQALINVNNDITEESVQPGCLLFASRFLDEISPIAFFIPFIGQLYLGVRLANDFQPLTSKNYSFFLFSNIETGDNTNQLTWNYTH